MSDEAERLRRQCDRIMAILALAKKQRGELTGDGIVATVMSNLGLRRLMAENGIAVHETKVGDRYVLEELERSGLTLGGEQSGHIIMAEHQTTGDGILTGLQLAAEVVRSGKSLSELADQMTVFPQVLLNVSGVDHTKLAGNTAIEAAVAEAEAQLGDSGRVVLRPSGTEPLVRVMVEAAERDEAKSVAEAIASVVRSELG